VDELWATKSEGVGLIVLFSVQLASKISNLRDHSTNVTDRQTDKLTDGRHAIARPRFALYLVHRAVKNVTKSQLALQRATPAVQQNEKCRTGKNWGTGKYYS